MIDRQKVETILLRRFPGAPLDQIAAAANAIIGLDDARVSRSREHQDSGLDGRSQCPNDNFDVALRLPRGSA